MNNKWRTNTNVNDSGNILCRLISGGQHQQSPKCMTFCVVLTIFRKMCLGLLTHHVPYLALWISQFCGQTLHPDPPIADHPRPKLVEQLTTTATTHPRPKKPRSDQQINDQYYGNILTRNHIVQSRAFEFEESKPQPRKWL